MGLFDFMRGKGRSVKKGNEAAEIKQDIHDKLGGSVEDLSVSFDDGTVTLRGKVTSHAARERAILLAGNVDGVEKVQDALLVFTAQSEITANQAAEKAAEERAAQFYTIQKGDSLSKIAKERYGDAMKWRALYEANSGVIDDPDKIYPGQTIRVPDLD
jgi:nucleoid-associated protein YgaU